MITAFTIKNFKAIGNDPVRIELKPITLLFGENSAGKSNILHALNYADVIFNSQKSIPACWHTPAKEPLSPLLTTHSSLE